MRAPRRGLWAALCALLLLAGVTGCGTQRSTAEDPRTPEEAVQQAVQNSAENTYRRPIRGHHEGSHASQGETGPEFTMPAIITESDAYTSMDGLARVAPKQ